MFAGLGGLLAICSIIALIVGKSYDVEMKIFYIIFAIFLIIGICMVIYGVNIGEFNQSGSSGSSGSSKCIMCGQKAEYTKNGKMYCGECYWALFVYDGD